MVVGASWFVPADQKRRVPDVGSRFVPMPGELRRPGSVPCRDCVAKVLDLAVPHVAMS